MTEPIQDFSKKGGEANRRPYKFSTKDLAAAKGKSVAAVRKDIQRGKLNPYSLISIAHYLAPGEWKEL